MAQQANDIINFFHGSLPKDRLEYLNAKIDNTLYHCFGASGRDNYYQHIKQIPDSLEEQRWWIRSHCEKLSALIEQHQEQLIVSKAAIQKR